MSSKTVVPIVITQRSGESDIVSAFEIAERAEQSKIVGWAQAFDFQLTEHIFIDLATQVSGDRILGEILSIIKRRSGDGIVVASSEYLKRTGLEHELTEGMKQAGKHVWIADLGSLPMNDRISA